MAATPRELWQATEGLHAVVYFAPEVAEAVAGAGVKGWWPGYFAGRAAPMGAVAPSVVSATFATFAPAMVERNLGSVRGPATPPAVLRARLGGVARALARLDRDGALSAAVDPVVGLLDRAADGAGLVGRPLGASWAAHRREVLDEVGDHLPSTLRAWLACTVLREDRGDAHVAALVEAGLDGCEANLTLVGTGRVPAAMLREARGWTEEEWDAAAGRLADRGLLHPDGRLTMAGIRTRTAVEDATDRGARRAWSTLEDTGRDDVVAALGPLGALIVDRTPVRVPNPMGWEPR